MTDWVDPDAMLAYMLGEDPYGDVTAPSFNPAMVGDIYGMTPQYDFEGDPISPSTQSSIWNRWRTSLFDPMFAGLGGGQAFAAGTFDPTISYEMIDSPALTALNMYRRNPQGSIEGMVLEELENGGTPATAFSHLRALAQQETPLGEMVRGQLLPATMPDGGVVEGEFDWGDVMQRISTVQQQMTEAPQVGPVGAVFDPETGNVIQQGGENVIMEDANGNPVMVRQVTTPSPLGEKYAELGLTPPGVEYQAQDFYTPEMEQAMAEYAGLGPTVDAARELFLNREEPGRMGAAQLGGAPINQVGAPPPVPPPGGGGGGGIDSVGGFNIPWAGQGGGPSAAAPGFLGSLGQMSAAVGGGVPWAIDVTANQMVPGGQLNTDALAAAVGAGSENDVIRNATTAATNPAGVLWGGIQSGWNALFPGAEEEEAAGGGGGTRPQARLPLSVEAMLGLKTPESARKLYGAAPSERPGSEEGPPPGTTVPGQEPGPPSGDDLTRWMQELASSGTSRDGAISYATANGVDPVAAGRAYDQVAGAAAAREAPPSASELPNYSQPTPHPSSMWPPSLLYDPWAPEQATGDTMAANMNFRPPGDYATTWDSLPWYMRQGVPTSNGGWASPEIAESMARYEAANAPPQSEGAPWAPPSNDFLGINWTGREPEPAPPGAADDFLNNIVQLGQGQFTPPTEDWLGINWTGRDQPEPPDTRPPSRPSDEVDDGHYVFQLPPGTPPGPPAPEPLTGLSPDERTPGHYIVQLTDQAMRDAATRSQVRPTRHPEAPYGGEDYEAMLQYMLTHSREQANPAAAPQFEPAPSETATIREHEQEQQAQQAERESGESGWTGPTISTRGGDRYRSVLGTGQSQRRVFDRRRQDFRDAYMARFNAMQNAYGADFGRALGMARAARDAGTTPFQQQVMARRMAIMASGMPTGNYLPGT